MNSSKNKVGRPKGPEMVLFRKRVPAGVDREGLASLVDSFVKGESLAGAAGVVAPAALAKKDDVGLLLEDIQRLTDDLEAARKARDEALGLSDDERVAYWKGKYLEVAGRLGSLEDQHRS